jgi:hypothetical protein
MSLSEEQRGELDALEAIYPDQYKLISEADEAEFELLLTIENPVPKSDVGDLEVKFLFKLPKDYPNVEPDIAVHTVRGCTTKKDESDLREFLKLQITEQGLLGQVMVFSLVNEATSWLQGRLEKMAEEKTQEEDAALREWHRRQAEEMEAAREAEGPKVTRFDEDQRLDGTPVTKDNFAEWKRKFDIERAEAQAAAKAAAAAATRRMTGREFFEMSNLNMDELEGELDFYDEEESADGVATSAADS